MASPFEWSLYLGVADHLLKEQPEEYLRSATSRAYYGVFGVIREKLEARRGSPFSLDRSVHRQVINSLIDDSRPLFKEVGRSLDRLEHWRNLADYDSNRPFTTNQARLAVLLARQIESQVPRLR